MRFTTQNNSYNSSSTENELKNVKKIKVKTAHYHQQNVTLRSVAAQFPEEWNAKSYKAVPAERTRQSSETDQRRLSPVIYTDPQTGRGGFESVYSPKPFARV